jgi:hypothetical protein
MYQVAALTSADGTVSVEAEKLLDDALEVMEDERLETWEKGKR